jgi:hypothetical protein
MKFENTWTGNWENAFRGLRHPMESYARSDSRFGIGDTDAWLDEEKDEVVYSYCHNGNENEKCEEINDWLARNGELRYGKYAGEYAYIGKNDLDLAQRMIKAGTPNDKFLRQIFVSVDITAPLYWWKEMDTYKVATTANSTSTMHKLATTPITKECFEMDDYQNVKMYDREPYNLDQYTDDMWDSIVCYCETLRQLYLETKDIKYWKELIRVLPESWLQTRTFTCNYAVLRNIYHWRKSHKLTEWHQFCDWMKTLPYADNLIVFDNN